MEAIYIQVVPVVQLVPEATTQTFNRSRVIMRRISARAA